MLEWHFSCTNMITFLQSFWIVGRGSCKIPCTFHPNLLLSNLTKYYTNSLPFPLWKTEKLKIPSTLRNRYSLIFLNVARIIWKCACRFSSTVASSKLLSFYYLDDYKGWSVQLWGLAGVFEGDGLKNLGSRVFSPWLGNHLTRVWFPLLQSKLFPIICYQKFKLYFIPMSPWMT
jgi:hypothetical protein